MNKAKKELFKNEQAYGDYIKTWEVNKDGDSYSKAVMNLITLFVEEKSCSNDVVKKSPDYKRFSGTQVEMAQGFYKQYLE